MDSPSHRFNAFGVSMGAKSLLHVTELHPQRVEAMVLVSAAPHSFEHTRAVRREAAAAPHRGDEWKLMRK